MPGHSGLNDGSHLWTSGPIQLPHLPPILRHDEVSPKLKQDDTIPITNEVVETNARKGTVGVITYFVSSLAIVFCNKTLYGSVFPYPIVLTFLQQLLGIFLGFTSLAMQRCMNIGARGSIHPYDFVACGIPAVAFVGYVAFANLCLMQSSVATYLITRSFTLPGTYLLSSKSSNDICHHSLLHSEYYLKQEVSSIKRSAVGVVFCGFLLGDVDVHAVSHEGMLIGAMSSICQVLFGVASREYQSSQIRKDNMSFYTAIWAAILLLPIATLIEDVPKALMSIKTLSFVQNILVVSSCVAGLTINIAVFAIVFHFSPLTYEIAGFFKAGMQSFLGILVLRDPASPVTIVSLTTILVGSLCYGADEKTLLTIWYGFRNRFESINRSSSPTLSELPNTQGLYRSDAFCNSKGNNSTHGIV